jgi:GTP-binding protein Era
VLPPAALADARYTVPIPVSELKNLLLLPMAGSYKSGFVNIFGAPNAGKSTLLNLLLGERLVIISPKVQTTRHRILGILSEPEYQIVFSDTPGIIEPKYKLHQKMMLQVKSALEDADVAILMHDITQPIEDFETISNTLKLKVPALLLLNKTDTVKDKSTIEGIVKLYKDRYPTWEVLAISARKETNTDKILPLVLKALPEGMPFYPDDSISDRNERFFVAELIREQIYTLYEEEIPYHAAVLIQSFEEKTTLNVIKADIIVSRETQKMILLGKGGSMIKQLGINSRKTIEEFLQKKVHLELFVKVRPKWRDNENYLREYGYNG